MSGQTVLLLATPIIVLILGVVVVIVVALCRAKRSDIPEVMAASCSILGRLAGRMPDSSQWHPPLDSGRPQPEAEHVAVEENR